jgi:hypothetical protein
MKLDRWNVVKRVGKRREWLRVEKRVSVNGMNEIKLEHDGEWIMC